VRRDDRRAAFLALDGVLAGNVAEIVGVKIGNREDTQNTGVCFGVGAVERDDIGMGVRAADQHRPGRRRRRDIVAVTPGARQEPVIFDPWDAATNSSFCH